MDTHEGHDLLVHHLQWFLYLLPWTLGNLFDLCPEGRKLVQSEPRPYGDRSVRLEWPNNWW